MGIENRMSKTTSDIVAKLWNLCNILKDDGVSGQAGGRAAIYAVIYGSGAKTAADRRKRIR
jgi:hypothetical protein